MDPKFYILIDRPAVALQRTAIYYVNGSDIRKWNFETGEDVLWSQLPASSGFIKIEISIDYIHAHFLGSLSGTQEHKDGTYTTAVVTSYRRKLDLSDSWAIYDSYNYVNWWGPGYNVAESIECATFPSGKSWYSAKVVWQPNPADYVRGYWDRITGEDAQSPRGIVGAFYYAKFDRTYIGSTYLANGASDAWSETRDYSGFGLIGSVNYIGSTLWVFRQVGSALHADEPYHYSDQGTVITGVNEHSIEAYTMGDFPPVPFGDRSLVVLASNTASGANSVWWDGANWADEFLGSSVSSFTTIRFRPGLAFCRTGKLYSLADGSLLHSLETSVVPTGWQVYPKRTR